MKYSYWKTALKTGKRLIVLVLSILAAGLMAKYPQWANFTVLGGVSVYTILIAVEDYLKHRWNIKI